MTYKPKYSHEDLTVFWRKDFMMEVQNCRNYISRILGGQGKTVAEADKAVLGQLKRTYPNGWESKYDCGDDHCPVCNPDAIPFD